MVVTFVVGTLEDTCRLLDKRRLNKQKTEAMQIINVLQNPDKKGWRNHPATLMWVGYVPALQYYYNAITNECIRRKIDVTTDLVKFTDEQLASIRYQTIDEYLQSVDDDNDDDDDSNQIVFPWWFTWVPFIASHQVSLMRKSPEYYTLELFIGTNIDIQPYVNRGYIWPHKLTRAQIAEFSPEYCSPIGAGAPANYRWTIEDVNKWMENPTVNPKTGRKIKVGGKGIYGDLLKAKRIYEGACTPPLTPCPKRV